jgi:hypothetical protein
MSEPTIAAVAVAFIAGTFALLTEWWKHHLRSQPLQNHNPGLTTTATTSTNIGKVISDVTIFLFLTTAAGFVIGVAVQQPDISSQPMDSSTLLLTPSTEMAMILANLIFGTIAFIISGARAGKRRWRHLIAVAVGVWLCSLVINVWLLGLPAQDLLYGIAPLMIIMVLGGVLSYVFNRS